MAETKKKGKATFVQTSTGIYSYELFAKAKKASSKQLKQTSKWMDQNGLITPPYSPVSFLVLHESNAVFARCVKQIATDVAGIGWSLQLKGDKKDNQAEFERLNAFLDHPNSDDSFRSILKQLLIDWGSIGWFTMEVIRDKLERTAEVYHLPAYTIRIHRDKTKYCQIRNNKKVWFKKFGYEKDITSKDGKEGTGLTAKTKANELIFYKNYYPRSDYYGVPDVLPAVGDVIGAISQRDYNLAFFQNYGVPAAIIVLEGEWEEEAESIIKRFINKEIKGVENAHKTLVISQPEGQDVKFTYKPLVQTEQKEASFRLYEQERRNAILVAYSMPPERVGVRVVGKLGGNVAEEATKIYVQGVVEPLQLDLEEIINEKLLQSEIYTFKFNDIDLRNYNAEVDRQVKQVNCAMKTPNEARNELGHTPYPEGDKFYIGASFIPVGEPREPLSKEEVHLMDLIKAGREIRGETD